MFVQMKGVMGPALLPTASISRGHILLLLIFCDHPLHCILSWHVQQTKAT